ncbi:MAG: RMD1 family protein [Deltaproteobacteria bacterium]|nr:MAG: RMD1 family protein [Deltaproteobacteria bacterium]TMB35155.1 MAG: RMD1 family protein [Deltaproteobacteria bacterium]
MTVPRTHQFAAVAFEENLSLRELAASYPEARLGLRDMRLAAGDGGGIFIYPFGAVVFHDVTPERREAELARLYRARPGLTTQVVRESFTVREEPGSRVDIAAGSLVVDQFGEDRAAVVALIVAQSAALEYYERIVAGLFTRTVELVDPLEKRGSVSAQIRRLHRFIGEAIATRNEVFTVLALLDKPDATWDDPAMDRIYDELRAEFDLVDRYTTMEQKLDGVQEALELVLDVARDRRMWLLEVTIVLLILFELLLEVFRRLH